MQFHAATVEAYLGEFDIHVIHFDDGRDQYLQLRVPEAPDDPREVEPGYGCVEVEINDQLFGGYNCFSAAELAREDRLVRQFGEVVVTFDLDDAAYADLRRGLEHAFRGFPGFRVVAAT